MTEKTPRSARPAAWAAVLLVLLAAAAVLVLDGPLRFVVGAVCIVGLIVCVRQLATARARPADPKTS